MIKNILELIAITINMITIIIVISRALYSQLAIVLTVVIFPVALLTENRKQFMKQHKTKQEQNRSILLFVISLIFLITIIIIKTADLQQTSGLGFGTWFLAI